MDRGPGQPLDLRKLGYFVAVAEELHFGRAAERLYIAQPVLSRAIRRLEQEVGAKLLQRDSRHVSLTPAGQQLLDDARVLLASAEAARRRATDLRTGLAKLTVGFFVGDAVAPAAERFREQHPDVEIAVLRVYWHDQVAVLHAGRADVGFVHLPVDDEGLVVVPVRQELRVAVLPAGHPCAAHETLSIADLADDPVTLHAGADPGWESSTTSIPARTAAIRVRARPSTTSRRSSSRSPPAGRSASSPLLRQPPTRGPASSVAR